jgi:hypothetical protein
MQAWPVACKNTDAENGSVLKTVITGEGGGAWFLERDEGTWKLIEGASMNIIAETTIDGDAAWKLFSRSFRKEDMSGRYDIVGDKALGEKILDMVSVMA